MPRNQLPKPTEAELAILQVLWERGPSTVREVTEALQEQRGTGYTTALKLMQIMTEKGLVVRDESKWSHVYEAAVPAEQTLILRAAITGVSTHVKPLKPYEVLPIGLAAATLMTVAGKRDQTTELFVEAELFDANTGQPVLQVRVDPQAIERFGVPARKQAFEAWLDPANFDHENKQRKSLGRG